MSAPTLADVIARGVARSWASEDIAAAVVAHLQSDAAVERARAAHCRAGCPDALPESNCEHECRVYGQFREEQTGQMRAAIAALLAGPA